VQSTNSYEDVYTVRIDFGYLPIQLRLYGFIS